MRNLRLSLYFILGLMFGGYVSLSHAGTKPANLVPGTPAKPGYTLSGFACFSTASDLCSAKAAQAGRPYVWNSGAEICINPNNGGDYFSPNGCTYPAVPDSYTCDSGWTLMPDGITCSSPCNAGDRTDGFVSSPKGTNFPGGVQCDGTCEYVNVLSIGGADGITTATHEWWPASSTKNGNTCSASTGNAASPSNNPAPVKKPAPCAAGEGVMTVGGSKIICVPAGTPGASTPVISKEKKVDVYPDASEKVTETTKTTDPNTAVSDVNVKVTTSGGQSGPAGSSSSGQSGSGAGEGSEPGQCAKEPNSPLCKVGQMGEKGQFTPQTAELAAAKADLLAEWNGINAQVSQMFGTLGSGAADLPCPPPIYILGKPISVCVSSYSNSLSGIGAAVLLMASLAAAFIIFKR